MWKWLRNSREVNVEIEKDKTGAFRNVSDWNLHNFGSQITLQNSMFTTTLPKEG